MSFNLGLPKVRAHGNGYCVYTWELIQKHGGGCPYKGCGKELLGAEKAEDAPANTVAVACEDGHRCHIWTSDSRPEQVTTIKE